MTREASLIIRTSRPSVAKSQRSQRTILLCDEKSRWKIGGSVTFIITTLALPCIKTHVQSVLITDASTVVLFLAQSQNRLA